MKKVSAKGCKQRFIGFSITLLNISQVSGLSMEKEFPDDT